MTRIGLDSNVVLRFLLDDDPTHSLAARNVILEAAACGTILVVNIVVLVEIAWVLARSYRRTRDDIIRMVELLLGTSEIELSERAAVEEALGVFRKGHADFPDALIGAMNQSDGCVSTLTFDRLAASLPSFTVIEV